MQVLFDNLQAIDITVPIGVKEIFLKKEKQQIKDAMQFTYMNMTDEEDFIGVDYFYEIRFNGGKNICPNCKQGILRLDRPGKMGCSVC